MGIFFDMQEPNLSPCCNKQVNYEMMTDRWVCSTCFKRYTKDGVLVGDPSVASSVNRKPTVVEMPKPQPKGDPNLPKILRDLADKVERGEVHDFIGAYIDNGNEGRYSTLVSTSISDSIVLSSLLWQTCVEKLRSPR